MKGWITTKKGPLLVVFSYLIWGALPIFWKLLQDVAPLYLLASRVVWSMVFLGLFILLTGRTGQLKDTMRDKKEMGKLFASGIVITINWSVLVIQVTTNHILDNSLGNYMVPLFSIVIGFFFFRERLDKLQWAAVAFATIGVIIVLVQYGTIPWLVLLAATTFPTYSAIKKTVNCDGIVSVFCETLWMLIPALGVMCWYECSGNSVTAALQGWELLLLPLSGVATSVPLWIFALGMRYGTPMTMTGMIMFISPTMIFIEGLVLYHEVFDPVYGILFGFVWTGVVLFFISSIRQHRRLMAQQ